MVVAVSESLSTPVSPEEVERRLAEFRRIGFERRMPAVGIYPGSESNCPWPGCDQIIKGVDFRLETLGDPEVCSRLLRTWWLGPGLIGKCPSCHRLVLFGSKHKSIVEQNPPPDSGLLPEDWFERAKASTGSES
jgi:hypothetical protein